MKISVPKNLSDCTPEQLSKWVFLSSGELNLETLSDSLDFRVQVVSIFSNVSKPKLYNTDAKGITDAFNHIVTILNQPYELKSEVFIEGVRYVFDKEFEHITTGAVIDLKLIESVYKSPYEVLSILYIEEGLKYNQVDDNDHIINPCSKRIEAFKKEFPGDEFLSVFAFFLDRWSKLKDAIFAVTILQNQITMMKTKHELKKEMKILNGSTGPGTSSS